MESVTNYELMQKLKEIECKLNNLSKELILNKELIKKDTHEEDIKKALEITGEDVIRAKDVVRADIPEDMRWMLNFE